MSQHVFKLPDLGEGMVSAEIVTWHVKPGDLLREDDPLVEMSTDKAVVEIPAPVSGKVIRTTGKPGDVIAVGAELALFELDLAPSITKSAPAAAPAAAPTPAPAPAAALAPATATAAIKASPATRRRALETGVSLANIAGSGPGGRIMPEDLALALTGDACPRPVVAATAIANLTKADTVKADAIKEIPVIGIRRVIAQRMSEAAQRIPHFSYIEEIDVTELHALRAHLNLSAPQGTPALSFLPFIVSALCRALARFPQCNAHYDAAREILLQHSAVHVGIATQTAEGLKVPVVRDAHGLALRALAARIHQAAVAARDRSARREQLSGSTITVTSLGKLGGIASTPIINLPEVAIVGVNRVVERPMVVAGLIRVRQMMNLSSSFDHRFVDGADAAGLIQAVKECLEHPAALYGEG